MSSVVQPSATVEPFSPEETLSLAERAYRRLRDAIVAGQLPAGTRLSERSLAAGLGVSAQPVREALRRLQAEGMVATAPRRGTVVAEFTAERLTDMSRIRVALEGVAAALAAQHATEADLDALEALLAGIRRAAREGDTEAVTEANARFHARVHAASRNAFLARCIDALRAFEHFGRIRALASSASEPPRSLREHAALLAALRSRDATQAEACMRDHVQRALVAAGLLPRPGRAPRRKATLSG
jgi:DNA-binding GntR family transcriptional regulator